MSRPELPTSGINPLTEIDLKAVWAGLSPVAQAELGAMLLKMVFTSFVAGDAFAEEDRYCSEEIRDAARIRSDEVLNQLDGAFWPFLPDLFGPEGGDPTWAWRAPATGEVEP